MRRGMTGFQRRRCAPGSRPNFRHNTTKPHIKDPRSMLDRHAEHMAADVTMMNLAGTRTDVSLDSVRSDNVYLLCSA